MRTRLPLAVAALALAAFPAFAAAPPAPMRPRLDVAFVLDTTGSMGDEIEVVKEKLVSIARKLGTGQPAPDVRFAVIAFRDKGDAYVVKTFPFDRDVKQVQRHILSLDADGGGDEPEDIAAALHATLALAWDPAANVARVAFLVGDAGPQHYAQEASWEAAVKNFKERKIEVHAVGCSGLNGEGLSTFKAVAERTSGDFEQLTYGRVERLADGKSRTVLTTGGETYVADGALAEKDWKRGASALVAEGRAKKASAPPAGAGGYAPSAAPTTNNLDAEISARLVRSAEKAGASY